MAFGDTKARILRSFPRPEKAAAIVDAINYAIEYLSTHDWSNDLVEGSLSLDSAAYAQSLVISTSFDRFRKMKYLRPSGYSIYLDYRDPARIFTTKSDVRKVGVENVDCWYRAGDNIVLKLGSLQSTMLYGFYQYPEYFTDESEDDDTVWYLDQMPSVVAELALSKLFDDVGNDSESSRSEKRAVRLLEKHIADKTSGYSRA